jgi:hypothetical protein
VIVGATMAAVVGATVAPTRNSSNRRLDGCADSSTTVPPIYCRAVNQKKPRQYQHLQEAMKLMFPGKKFNFHGVGFCIENGMKLACMHM